MLPDRGVRITEGPRVLKEVLAAEVDSYNNRVNQIAHDICSAFEIHVRTLHSLWVVEIFENPHRNQRHADVVASAVVGMGEDHKGRMVGMYATDNGFLSVMGRIVNEYQPAAMSVMFPVDAAGEKDPCNTYMSQTASLYKEPVIEDVMVGRAKLTDLPVYEGKIEYPLQTGDTVELIVEMSSLRPIVPTEYDPDTATRYPSSSWYLQTLGAFMPSGDIGRNLLVAEYAMERAYSAHVPQFLRDIN